MTRIGAAVVAFLVAAAGVGFAVWVFGRDVHRPARPSMPERIAFVRPGPKLAAGVDNTDIFIVQPTGTGLRNLTDDPAAVQSVRWSADGTAVAFIRRSIEKGSGGKLTERAGIYVMQADGSGLQDLVPCEQSYCEIRDFALSSDGSRLAFVRPLDGAGYRLEVVRTDGGEHQVIECPRCRSGMAELAWSPDGERIAFDGAVNTTGPPGPSSIYVADVRDGRVRQLTPEDCGEMFCSRDVRPVWSPDGTSIAFARDAPSGTGLGTGFRHELMVMNSDGSHQRVVLSCDQCFGTGYPVWSPDGLSFALVNGTEGSMEIWVLPSSGGIPSKIRLCSGGTCLNPTEIVWSPDSSKLAFLEGEGFEQSLYVLGANGQGLSRLAEGVDCCLAWLPASGPGARTEPSGPSRGGTQPSASKSPTAPPSLSHGVILFASDGGTGDEPNTGIFVTRPDGTGLASLTDAKHSDLHPEWSPNGKSIAFDRLLTSDRQIFVMNADGSDITRLTDLSDGADQPTWSPDGRQLAFVRYGPGDEWAIFAMNSDGSGIRRVTLGENGTSDPAWSPGGNWIAFQRRGDLYLVHPDGTGQHRLTRLPGEEGRPSWSPDGETIAFQWYSSAGEDLYLIGSDGTNLRRLTNLGGSQEAPTWSPDGQWIAFAHSEGIRNNRVEVIRADGTGLQHITPDGFSIYDPSWGPA